jgi:phosphoserine phosphatase RsbU/P
MKRFSLLRFAVLFKKTTPLDRLAITILLLFAITRLVALVRPPVPLSSLLGFLGFLAILYFLIRLVPWFRAHVMWRLRNRLIVAYILIAVVPVVLLLFMAGISAYGLYLEFGAHLLHDDLEDRINLVSSDAGAIAGAIEQEAARGPVPADETILARPEVARWVSPARKGCPDLQVLPGRGRELLKQGDGHRYSGLAVIGGRLWIASAVSLDVKDGPKDVLVGMPVTSSLLDRLPSELGPIQLMLFEKVASRPPAGTVLERNGRIFVSSKEQEVASRQRILVPPASWFDVRVPGVSTWEAAYSDPRQDTEAAPVVASFTLRPSALNHALSTSLGEIIGPLLVNVLLVASVVFLLLEAAALVTGIVLTRTITHAVADLYEATLRVRRGDFTHRVRVRQRDQLGALGESFNEMTSSVSELIAEQRRRQRLENEISIAREVQEQLFPSSLPSLPGLQLAALCRPARVVSGDYYDFIRLGPSCVGIVLADISGKGIFAALLMASLQAALRSMAPLDGHDSTAVLVSRLNAHLYKNTSDDRYATLFYAVYDSESMRLTYTNAGHLAPFLVSGTGVHQLEEGGTVVGLFEDCPYTQRTVHVNPGSVLVAFSDGLTEPENVYGEEFGLRRLKEEILRQRDAAPQQLAENLISAAEQWAGSPEQADDITVVVARMG